MATGYPHARKYAMTHQEPLRFHENGEFRILHLADIHKLHPKLTNESKYASNSESKSMKTLKAIRECIEIAKPDLVVFGGDNISGYLKGWTAEHLEWCINEITEAIREKNIPLSIVFGNHDAEQEKECPFLSREIQMTLYMNYDNFRGSYNEEDIYGVGNCHIPVLACGNDDVVWNIWCIDSNDLQRKENYETLNDTAIVEKSQIEWYERTVQREKEKYGRTIPAILFQHIPVNQVNDFIEECDRENMDYETKGKYYRTKKDMLLEGKLREMPCTSPDRSQFDSWIRCGDIKAAFFGHDHTNTFHYMKNGISLYQTVTCGYENYGEEHGGRLIILLEDGKMIKTEMIVVDKLLE